MPIKTVSLETAKLLKEKGFNAFAEYKWCGLKTSKYILNQEIPNTSKIEWFLIHESDSHFHAHSKEWMEEFYYAYCTDELLEKLPIGSVKWTGLYRHFAMWRHDTDNWQCAYVLPVGEGYFGWQDANSPAEVCAKMWLYLNAEGLLNAKR